MKQLGQLKYGYLIASLSLLVIAELAPYFNMDGLGMIAVSLITVTSLLGLSRLKLNNASSKRAKPVEIRQEFAIEEVSFELTAEENRKVVQHFGTSKMQHARLVKTVLMAAGIVVSCGLSFGYAELFQT